MTDLTTALESARPYLARIAAYYDLPSEDAEDILQDAVLLALERPAGEIRTLPEWLAGTFRTKCKMYWRLRRHPLAPVPLLEFDLADPRQHRAARDARLDVAKLAAPERPKVRALLAAFLAGAGLGEVAERSGYSEASLRKILRRAIDRMAQRVGRTPAPLAAMALSTRRKRRDAPPEADPWEALAEAGAAAREVLARSRAMEREVGWP